MPEDPEEDQDERSRPRPRVVDKRVSARTPEEAAREPREPRASSQAAPEAEPASAPRTPPAPETPAATETPGATGTAAEAPPATGPAMGAPDSIGAAESEVWTPEQEEAARAIAREMAERPAEDWVLSSAINLANVAGAKLQIGDAEGARLAIDALSGIVDAIGDRLAEVEAPLRQTLAQLKLAYAQTVTGSPPAPPPA